MAIWAVFFVERWCGGLMSAALSLLALLLGGGFVPVYIGLVAGATASRLHAPPKPGGRGWRILAASGLLFLVFDVGLPVLAALSGYARSKR